MGRQIQLSMLPADRDALLEQIQRDENVMVLLRDGDSQTVHPLPTIPEKIPGTLILCHREFTPTLERKLIASATPPYYRVDDFELPVLEFSDSLLTEWEKRPALTQGRIYGQFT